MAGPDMQQQEFQLANSLKVSGPGVSNKLAMFSAKASAVMAARMLDFVREMSLGSEDFSQRQSDYWVFVLQDYSPPLIERAFHQWVKQSKHMPVPSEILSILDAMVEANRRDGTARDTEYYLADLRETRQRLAEAGEPYGPAQCHGLLKEALERVKKFPALPDPNHVPTLKERLARAEQERVVQRKPAGKVETASGLGAEWTENQNTLA